MMIAFLLGAVAMLVYVVVGSLAYFWWYQSGPEGEYGITDYLVEIFLLLVWPISIPVAMVRFATKEAWGPEEPVTGRPPVNQDFFRGDR